MSAYFGGKIIADGLYNLDENDENDDGEKHERKIQALIAVGECEVTYAAGTDGTGHSRGAEKPDRTRGDREDERAPCLWKQKMPDNFKIGRAHGLCSLDDAVTDLQQGILEEPCEIRGDWG